MSPATHDPTERLSPATTGEPKRPFLQRRFVRTALCCAAIVAAGIIAYSDSLHGPFIFDDSGFFGPVSAKVHRIRGILAGSRPVADLTFALNYSLGGMDVWGYHLLNLAIHVLAALTLFGVARRTLVQCRLPNADCRMITENDESTANAARPECNAVHSAVIPQHSAIGNRHSEIRCLLLALAIALLWVVHPLLTQAVTYVVQRAESLMGLFFLLTLYCFIRAVSAPRARSRGAWQVGAVAACGLGMGCKQVMVAAPLVTLFYDRSFVAASFREALRRRWRLYLALAATWLILARSVREALSPHPWSAGFALPGVRPVVYAWNETAVILHYLRLAFWPSGLCLDYGWPYNMNRWVMAPCAIVMGILLAATLWALIRKPALGFLGAWFFLILAPTSSFMPIRDLAFEQRMYLPLAAVVALAAVAARLLAGRLAARLWASEQGRRRARIAAGVVLMLPLTIALGERTYVRNRDYRSAVSIWTATTRVSPQNARAWSNLGQICFYEGRYDEAKADCTKAIRLRPDFADAYNNLGLALAAMNQLNDALHDYNEAIRLNPSFAEACINRANVYDALGRSKDAVPDYDRAAELRPGDMLIYINRAVTYYRLKEYAKALADLEKYKQLGGVPPEELVGNITRAMGRTR